jgi:hypothetical protein
MTQPSRFSCILKYGKLSFDVPCIWQYYSQKHFVTVQYSPRQPGGFHVVAVDYSEGTIIQPFDCQRIGFIYLPQFCQSGFFGYGKSS